MSFSRYLDRRCFAGPTSLRHWSRAACSAASLTGVNVGGALLTAGTAPVVDGVPSVTVSAAMTVP